MILFLGDLAKDIALLESEDGDEKTILPTEGLCEFLLDDTYRDYLDDKGEVRSDRLEKFEAFVWFVKNIFFSVNCAVTDMNLKEVEMNEDRDFISKAFTVSDEAFAVMLLLNYEKRWSNQVKFPTSKREELNKDPLYETRFTSSTKGYSKCSWSEEGIALYNEWYRKISKLRASHSTGKILEGKVLDFINEKKKSTKRKAKKDVLQNLPVVGGALQAKLAALAAGNTVISV